LDPAMNFLLETLRLGLANLALHKLRSFLTALGIIFGVAAVITMVAIGEGNKRKALAEIAQLGSRNIIIHSVKPPQPTSAASDSAQRMINYGLLRRDVRRIEQTVPSLAAVVPIKQVGTQVYNGVRTTQAAVLGTLPNLVDVASLRVARGRFLTASDLERLENVAVVGAEVAQRLFPLQDPLASELRVDQQTFRVVGVLDPVGLAGGTGTALVGRDLNFDVYIPLTAATSRFGDLQVRRQAGSFEATQVELSDLILQVADQDAVIPAAEQIRRTLELEHAQQQDVSVTVPLELLAQAERTQRMFNALMIAIASISLLVGGIGIMNIMLASVTERTREIGIRRALGATRRHIVAQFLVETMVLSGLGGVIGVGVGLGGAMLLVIAHEFFPAIERPEVTLWSIAVSFIVATLVGVVFGVYPAVKASQQDPIVALRHD
jgi:putative ABC transport system permease protein